MNDIPFDPSVPKRHQEVLREQYRQYCRQYFVRHLSAEIQELLVVWVSKGNDPFHSNRYGFYNPSEHRYLHFIAGERQACRVIGILGGRCIPCRCTFDQYGEPLPLQGERDLWNPKELRDHGIAPAARLLNELKLLFSSSKR